MRYTTLEIIQQAAVEMGFQKPLAAVTSTDDTALQLVALLRAVGEELVRDHEWQSLLGEFTMTTTAGLDTYSLPTDWSRPINQTEWSRTNHWRLSGPKSSQEWQTLKGGLLASGPRTRFRFKGNKIVFHPVPGADESIALEYISNAWVLDGSTGLPKSVIQSDSDKHLFDDRVLIDGLKLKTFEIKGWDTTAFRMNYEHQLQLAKDQVNGAPMLSLTRRNQTPVLLSSANIPDGNW